jgi:hypothetical protein
MYITITRHCTVQVRYVAKKSAHLVRVTHHRACEGNACRAKHQILGSRYIWSTISILRLSLGLAPRGSFQRRPGAPCPDAESCQIKSHGDVTVFRGISSTGWLKVGASEGEVHACGACVGCRLCCVVVSRSWAWLLLGTTTISDTILAVLRSRMYPFCLQRRRYR